MLTTASSIRIVASNKLRIPYIKIFEPILRHYPNLLSDKIDHPLYQAFHYQLMNAIPAQLFQEIDQMHCSTVDTHLQLQALTPLEVQNINILMGYLAQICTDELQRATLQESGQALKEGSLFSTSQDSDSKADSNQEHQKKPNPDSKI